MKRAARLSLWALGGLLLLGAVLVAALVGTQAGTDVAWRLAARFVPPEVSVARLEGRLIGPLVLRDVRYEADPIVAHLDRVELDWRPGALLGSAVSIDTLALDGVRILYTPGEEPAPATDTEPFALPQRIDLPVTIDVDRIAATDVVLEFGEAEPIVIDSLAFGMTFAHEHARIRDFALDAPLFDARLNAEATLSGRYPLAVSLTGSVRPEGDLAPLALQADASGELEDLTVRLAIEPPYRLELETAVRDALTGPALDGVIRAQVRADEIGLDLPFSEASLDAAFNGTPETLETSGRAEVALPELVRAALQFDLRRDGERLLIDALTVADSASPATIELTGTATLGESPAVNLDGRWRALRWPLAGEPVVVSDAGDLEVEGTLDDLAASLDATFGAGRIAGDVRRIGERFQADLEWSDLAWPLEAASVRSPRGALEVGGTFDDYLFTLDADLEPGPAAPEPLRADFASGRVAANGAGGSDVVRLDRLELDYLGGTLTGDAEIVLAPAVGGELRLDFAGLDPGLFAPEWAGAVNGQMQARAHVADGGAVVQIEELALDGRVRERPIELDLRGRLDTAATRVEVETLNVLSGGSRLRASGRIDETLDVEWSLASASLDDFWPGIAGRLDTSGHLAGPRERPRVEATVSGEQLAYGTWRVDRLQLEAALDATGEAHSDVELAVEGARVGETRVETVELTAAGTAAGHELHVAANGADVVLDLSLHGTLERPWQSDFAWRFTLDQSRIGYGELAPWEQAQAAEGTLVAGGAELESTCWRSGESSLCVEATRSANADVSAHAELSALPFTYFAALLPPDARIGGSVAARASIDWPADGLPQVDASIETTRSRVRSVTAPATGGVVFAPGHATAHWDGTRLDVELALPLANEPGGLDARVALDQTGVETLGDARLDGELQARFASLAFISDVVPELGDVSGGAVANLHVGGTVAVPALEGRASIEGGAALVRAAGVRIEDLHVTVDGSGRSIAIDADASSGGGRLSVDGALSFEPVGPVGRLALRGEHFEVFNSPDARVFASPALDLDLAETRIDLTGRIALPEARFTPRDALSGAVTVSSDEIIVDEEVTPARDLSRPFHARILLELGDAVTVQGFGLSGRLAGGIEIVEVPSEPVTGSGELRVEEGTYEAYGQQLEVRTGRLLFAGGALTRPGVDIEAVRRPAEDILVGARVRGTLDRPELSVFSEPPMPRQEQLSYLVLGRPLESTSSSETSALSQAAMALGLRGGNAVSERLNNALGFDEFGIQTQPADAASASFVIGKYLTPSLYVSYGVGLFEPVNTLRLRYTISSRWRLVTESSSVASGGDLIYNIERR